MNHIFLLVFVCLLIYFGSNHNQGEIIARQNSPKTATQYSPQKQGSMFRTNTCMTTT